jgi:hypothetical protein
MILVLTCTLEFTGIDMQDTEAHGVVSRSSEIHVTLVTSLLSLMVVADIMADVVMKVVVLVGIMVAVAVMKVVVLVGMVMVVVMKVAVPVGMVAVVVMMVEDMVGTAVAVVEMEMVTVEIMADMAIK